MDLGVAKHLDATYHPNPFEIISYHCQQAAEKGIKVLIMYYGAEDDTDYEKIEYFNDILYL